LRQEARVNQNVLPRDVHHRAVPQPIEQIVPICSSDDVIESVVLATLHAILRKRQQVQIVVAEHDHGAIPETTYEAQGGERRGTAVDQIANEPQMVPCAIEAERLEQPLQLVETPLNVTDRVGGHAGPLKTPGAQGPPLFLSSASLQSL
jgi:hypothetical protein